MSVHIGKKTVSDRMIGCWRRNSIRFATGEEDLTTRVVWLQTASGMADMRIAATRPDIRDRGGLADCSDDELLALAEQDCSCGITLLDEAAQPWPTATWKHGQHGFALQPVSRYPEPGWFEWREQDACMIERAPSGTYEEDWRLQPRSRDNALHIVHRGRDGRENFLMAGDHLMYARDRAQSIHEAQPLPDLVAASLHDRGAVIGMLDFELSYAQRQADHTFRIVLSSLPWREEAELDLGWTSNLKETAVLKDPDGRTWQYVSAWQE